MPDGYQGHDVQVLNDNGRRYFTCSRCGLDHDALVDWTTVPPCTGKPRS